MKVNELFKNYEEYCRLFKNKNQRSLRTELNDVKYIHKCLIALGQNEILIYDRELYLKLIKYYRENSKAKNTTINKRMELLGRICKYNQIAINYDLKKLPDDTTPFQPLQEKTLKTILNYATRLDITHQNNQAYQLAVFMLLDTGCRVSELLEIKIKNIDLANKCILLDYTKNTEQRYVFFTRMTADLIKNMMERNSQFTEYLFYNYYKKHQMTPSNIRWFFDQVKEELNLKQLHAHQFRKTLATVLDDNNCDLITIQKILGHKSLEMTKIYIMRGIAKTSREYQKNATWHDSLNE